MYPILEGAKNEEGAEDVSYASDISIACAASNLTSGTPCALPIPLVPGAPPAPLPPPSQPGSGAYRQHGLIEETREQSAHASRVTTREVGPRCMFFF